MLCNVELPPFRLAASAIVISFLACFQTGYHFSVVNNPADILQEFINSSFNAHYGRYVTDTDQLMWLWGATVSAISIPAIAGSLTMAFFSERFGRRITLFLIAPSLAIVANVCMGASILANSFELLALGRLLVGYVSGLQGGVLAVYLSECSPSRFRARIGALQNLLLCLSALIGVSITLPGTAIDVKSAMPYLLGAGAVPAIIQIFLCPIFPESPKYLLLTKGDEERAGRSVLFFHGTNTDVEDVFDEFREEQPINSDQNVKMGFVEAFRRPEIRAAIVNSAVVNAAQVCTGAFVILQFSSRLFDSANIDEVLSTRLTVAVIGALALSAMCATPIMDLCRRRTLLLSSLVIAAICNVVYVVFSNVLDGVPSFVCCFISLLVIMIVFSIGPGPIGWMIAGELAPQSARSVAVSIAGSTNVLCSFITTLVFPPLSLAIGTYSLLLLVGLSICFIIWLFFYLPETNPATRQGYVPLA